LLISYLAPARVQRNSDTLTNNGAIFHIVFRFVYDSFYSSPPTNSRIKIIFDVVLINILIIGRYTCFKIQLNQEKKKLVHGEYKVI
jgi:hypothetical protein